MNLAATPAQPLRDAIPRWERAALFLILLLAASLRFWRLAQNEFSNSYYAAAARSMNLSWSNFLFASFDPGGYVSVDKPPVALWLQAISVKILGFNGIALILPQALAGIAAVGLIYLLVRKSFGGLAGLLAALALTLTPISVAVDRSNLPDSILVLFLLLAAGALLDALQTGRLKAILLCAVLLGIAFNVKMMAAFVVLPTFTLLYLGASRVPGRQRLLSLGAAAVALVAVSLSWAALVDSTPQTKRPYVGSSANNSELSLIIGYNGMGRLYGQEGNAPFGGMGGPGGPGGMPPMPGNGSGAGMPMPPGGMMPPGMGGMGGAAFGGTPGPLRLAQSGMADQITWLFPLAGIGFIAALFSCGRGLAGNPRTQHLLLWGGWLGTYAIVYSFARGIIHQYYLVTLAPALAALVGIGFAALWQAYRESARRGWLLPGALLLTAGWQGYVLSAFPDWNSKLLPLLLGGTLLATLGLIFAWLADAGTPLRKHGGQGATHIGVMALLLCPAAWALTPVVAKGNSMLPSASPSLVQDGAFDPFSMMQMPAADIDRLAAFLREHRRGERYALMASDLQTAASIIIRTGEPVAALGGFIGADPILTPERFARMVEERQVRFVLCSPMDDFRSGNNSKILAWVRQHGTRVPGRLWRSQSATTEPAGAARQGFDPMMGMMPGGMAGMMQLYDCATTKMTQDKGDNDGEILTESK